jgi:hypothetical protein
MDMALDYRSRKEWHNGLLLAECDVGDMRLVECFSLIGILSKTNYSCDYQCIVACDHTPFRRSNIRANLENIQ